MYKLLVSVKDGAVCKEKQASKSNHLESPLPDLLSFNRPLCGRSTRKAQRST